MMNFHFLACELSNVGVIPLGHTGEHNATRVTIDATEWQEEYPNGALALLVRNPNGIVYPAQVETNGYVLTWNITRDETAIAGNGEIELILSADGYVVKSARCTTQIDAALSQNADDPPTGTPEWVSELLGSLDNIKDANDTIEAAKTAADEATDAAKAANEAAKASVHSPYIDTATQNWMVWSTETNAYRDTGIKAVGPQGETGPKGETGSIENLTINGKTPDAGGAVTLTPEDLGAASAESVNQLKDETAYVTGNARNGLYRGKNLGELGSEAEWAAFLEKYQVSQGLFVTADKSDALYLGDYVTIKNAGVYSGEWMIAGFNTHKNVGDNLDAVDGVSNAGSVNHIAMIPRGAGFAYGTPMNSTSTTANGYAGSAMYTHLRETAVPALAGSLGKRLLTRRVSLTTAVDTNAKAPGYSGWVGAANSTAWRSSRAELMSETQVYGSAVWGGAYDAGESYEKLPVFNFITPVAFGRHDFWLRSVASIEHFAGCDSQGGAAAHPAYGTWIYVRPLIMVG